MHRPHLARAAWVPGTWPSPHHTFYLPEAPGITWVIIHVNYTCRHCGIRRAGEWLTRVVQRPPGMSHTSRLQTHFQLTDGLSGQHPGLVAPSSSSLKALGHHFFIDTEVLFPQWCLFIFIRLGSSSIFSQCRGTSLPDGGWRLLSIICEDAGGRPLLASAVFT